MKIFISRLTWLLFIIVGSLGSCTNSDDDQSMPNNPDPQVITQGDWKVTWYWDKDKDETNDFASYVFNFNGSGAFESTNAGSTVNGTWQATTDDGSQRLAISSGSVTKPLTDLDDDWIIVSMTSNKIELKDDNDEHLEELRFEKI